MLKAAIVINLLARILRGERYRNATPEEWRVGGASLSLGCIVVLVLISFPNAWTLPRAILWVCVVLFLFPLAALFLWTCERVPPGWSMTISAATVILMFALASLPSLGPVSPHRAAQAGLILHIGLMMVGPAKRWALPAECEEPDQISASGQPHTDGRGQAQTDTGRDVRVGP